jgi:hypothetical protein
MDSRQISRFDNRQVIVTLRDGTKRLGRLYATPEEGLYHIMRDPARAGEIIGGFLEDLYAAEIVDVKPLQ